MRIEVLVRHVFVWTVVLVSLVSWRSAVAQPTVLDGFESPDGWKVITAEGVRLSVQTEEGVKGKCLRLDYDFVSGAGYCIVQKAFGVKLPANYEFAFQLRGEGPANNLEFKLLDASGESVWWHNRRALEWPRAWTRMIDKKRSLEFAWGPSGGAPLMEASKIEFAISSANGGKGSVWLDELAFRELPLESHEPLKPTATASVTLPGFEAASAVDGDRNSAWVSGPLTQQDHPTLTLDLGRVAEVGGLEIDWGSKSNAASFHIESSDDGETWTKLTGEHQPLAFTTIVPTPEAEARYLRLAMTITATTDQVSIPEVRLKPAEFSASPNAMFAALAGAAPRGRYPRYFSNEQSYWTVIGVDGDDAEALMNEEGAIELCKRGPTLEPFITMDAKTLAWASGAHTASLEKGYLPIPMVAMSAKADQPGLTVTAFADGAPGASLLWITYRLKNPNPSQGAETLRGRLHIALRPFQVNPPWQKLNNEGGFAALTVVDPADIDGRSALTFNRDYSVVALDAVGRAGVARFESGDVSEWIASDRWTIQKPIEDPDGRASGEIAFDFELRNGQDYECTLVFAMHGGKPAVTPGTSADKHRDACAKAWDEKVSRATIIVPKADQWITDTFKSQVAYILINRDGPAIQPGSRSYERSWAADGSLTSAALLSCGHPDEVKAWIDWFGANQFASGKVPCVVDKRGADPVPEHDSSGEYIWAVANYYRFTHDRTFLESHWKSVQKAVVYLQKLRMERMTPEFATPGSPKHAFYGLVPESISHEGYSAKAMHSYWDDFFVLLGLKEAAWLAGERAPESDEAPVLGQIAADFRVGLYDSMRLAMAEKKIDYIPGCVELGDFDSTSTTIALFPCDEEESAPQPALKRTFDRYWEFFQARRSSLSAWDAYTPYEIRHVGAFVRLGEPQRAYEALLWFHKHQRPQAWNHWAEVVWGDPLTPKFIGDMPHTWVGSDYLNSVCSIFVYEHGAPSGAQVVTFAGVPRAWVDSGEVVGFNDIVTSRGKMCGSLQLNEGRVRVKLWATGAWGTGEVVIKKPPGAKGQDAVVRGLPAQFRSSTLSDSRRRHRYG